MPVKKRSGVIHKVAMNSFGAMIIARTVSKLQKHVTEALNKKMQIGFVPTMGALHQGHIALIERCVKENDFSVCSLFVNPTQFNNPDDLKNYPRTEEADLMMLEKAKCNLVFIPTVEEMYPANKLLELDFGEPERMMEGKFRPGHYQGVCQVVHRLLKIVQPDNLYLGQKDYQQCMVISRLVELVGIKDKIHINICPTLRETDGLAMSSRNMRLSNAERKKAVLIFQSLSYIKENLVAGETDTIKNKAIAMLSDEGFRVDYIEIADAKTLEPVSIWDGKKKLVTLAAAFLNEVRLIDNLLLN